MMFVALLRAEARMPGLSDAQRRMRHDIRFEPHLHGELRADLWES